MYTRNMTILLFCLKLLMFSHCLNLKVLACRPPLAPADFSGWVLFSPFLLFACLASPDICSDCVRQLAFPGMCSASSRGLVNPCSLWLEISLPAFPPVHFPLTLQKLAQYHLSMSCCWLAFPVFLSMMTDPMSVVTVIKSISLLITSF